MGKKLIVILCLLASPAFAEGYNENAKECLQALGFDPSLPVEERLRFPFNYASICTDQYRQEEWRARVERDREFIAAKPWYRGKNWKWEERAEYTCRRITNLSGTYEVCSKPIYIN